MDNGILSLFLMDPETSLLENLVAVTLKKRYGDGLYFYHRNIEVDFYLDEAHKAIQVSYSLKDPETRKREVNALLKLAENVAVDDLCIITRDEEEMIVEGEKTIRVVPVLYAKKSFTAKQRHEIITFVFYLLSSSYYKKRILRGYGTVV